MTRLHSHMQKSAQEGVKTKEGSLDDFMGYNSTSYSGGLG